MSLVHWYCVFYVTPHVSDVNFARIIPRYMQIRLFKTVCLLSLSFCLDSLWVCFPRRSSYKLRFSRHFAVVSFVSRLCLLIVQYFRFSFECLCFLVDRGLLWNVKKIFSCFVSRRNMLTQPIIDDFRYMKFIYLHCGEEMKLKDPRS